LIHQECCFTAPEFSLLQELRRLWDSRDTGGLFGPDNTLLIDDSTYKVSDSCCTISLGLYRLERSLIHLSVCLYEQASLNPPHTAIHPPAWDDPERLAEDAELSPQGPVRLSIHSVDKGRPILDRN